MNQQQVKSLQRATNLLTSMNKLSSGEWLNGPLIFRIEDGFLIATNTTDEKKWFETEQFLMAGIGPKGGLKVYQASKYMKI